jgi:hypothetical protein
MMHSAFAFNLCKLVEYNQTIGIETHMHFNMGTLIVNQRELLVKMAQECDSTHILWLDSDMMFNADVAQLLLHHDKPVVAGNYVTRQYPHKTVAYDKMSVWNSYVTHSDSDAPLVEVEAVGMGCMLTDIKLFDKLAKPYFNTVWIEHSQDHLGEDFYFCSNVRKLGYPILIDSAVSLTLKHLGTYAFHHSMVKTNIM